MIELEGILVMRRTKVHQIQHLQNYIISTDPCFFLVEFYSKNQQRNQGIHEWRIDVKEKQEVKNETKQAIWYYTIIARQKRRTKEHSHPWTFKPARGRRGSASTYGSPVSVLNKSLIQAP